MRQTSSSTRPPPSPSSASVTLAALLWLAVTSSSLPDDLPVTSSSSLPHPVDADVLSNKPFPGPMRAGRLDIDGEQAPLIGDRRARGRRDERGEVRGTSACVYEGRGLEGNGTEGDAKKTGDMPAGGTRLERNVSESSLVNVARERRSPGARIRRAPRILQDPMWTAEGTLFLELVVVADYSMYRQYGSGVGRRVQQIVNAASGFYRQLNIVMVLTEVKVWSRGNEITVSQNRHTTLNNFETYRKRLLKEEPHLANDNTIFLS